MQKSSAMGSAAAPSIEGAELRAGHSDRVGSRIRRTPPQSVERLVRTATSMFSKHGIHATGIDRILAKADVPRGTLYNHFGSKEGLVREVLRRESQVWFERLDKSAASSGQTVRDRLAAYFDVLRDWFSEPDFKGCIFMNAVGESSLDDGCVRPIAEMHRTANVAYMRRLLGDDAGDLADDTGDLADAIVSIANGATVDVMVTGDLGIVDRARQVVLSLVAPDSRTARSCSPKRTGD